jgi:hypothetical protein
MRTARIVHHHTQPPRNSCRESLQFFDQLAAPALGSADLFLLPRSCRNRVRSRSPLRRRVHAFALLSLNDHAARLLQRLFHGANTIPDWDV